MLWFSEILENELKKVDVNKESGIARALKSAFLHSNQRLISGHIDCTFSGTTLVSLLMIDKKFYTSNVGDSRAVIFNNKNNIWKAKALSNDHKPDVPTEKKRIEKNGGRCEPYWGMNFC